MVYIYKQYIMITIIALSNFFVRNPQIIFLVKLQNFQLRDDRRSIKGQFNKMQECLFVLADTKQSLYIFPHKNVIKYTIFFFFLTYLGYKKIFFIVNS